ncbi:hypothetical protein DFJ74DRAFT_682180, partial [Hyaloraphidium curvatum]
MSGSAASGLEGDDNEGLLRMERRLGQLETDTKKLEDDMKQAQKVPFLQAFASFLGVSLLVMRLFARGLDPEAGIWVALLAATMAAIPILRKAWVGGMKM